MGRHKTTHFLQFRMKCQSSLHVTLTLMTTTSDRHQRLQRPGMRAPTAAAAGDTIAAAVAVASNLTARRATRKATTMLVMKNPTTMTTSGIRELHMLHWLRCFRTAHWFTLMLAVATSHTRFPVAASCGITQPRVWTHIVVTHAIMAPEIHAA